MKLESFINNDLKGVQNKYKLTFKEISEIVPSDVLASIVHAINDGLVSKNQVMRKIEEYAKKYKGEKDGSCEGNR